MYIHQAVKKAVEQNGIIMRTTESGAGVCYGVKPTNSHDACLLILGENKKEKIVRWWNPKADDLMANDWEVIKE